MVETGASGFRPHTTNDALGQATAPLTSSNGGAATAPAATPTIVRQSPVQAPVPSRTQDKRDDSGDSFESREGQRTADIADLPESSPTPPKAPERPQQREKAATALAKEIHKLNIPFKHADKQTPQQTAQRQAAENQAQQQAARQPQSQAPQTQAQQAAAGAARIPQSDDTEINTERNNTGANGEEPETSSLATDASPQQAQRPDRPDQPVSSIDPDDGQATGGQGNTRTESPSEPETLSIEQRIIRLEKAGSSFAGAIKSLYDTDPNASQRLEKVLAIAEKQLTNESVRAPSNNDNPTTVASTTIAEPSRQLPPPTESGALTAFGMAFDGQIPAWSANGLTRRGHSVADNVAYASEGAFFPDIHIAEMAREASRRADRGRERIAPPPSMQAPKISPQQEAVILVSTINGNEGFSGQSIHAPWDLVAA